MPGMSSPLTPAGNKRKDQQSLMPEEGKKRSAEEGDSPASNRLKQTVDKAVVDEFICPITNELPLEPVIAEDGRCYEKKSIEEYFRRGGESRRSPVTNEPMGRRLIPALQVRNMLENLVRDGAVEGEKAGQWKKRIENEKRVAETRRKAESGDADAMNCLGIWYEHGERGIEHDYSEAFKWYKKADDSGHFSAMASLGMFHIRGEGTEVNIPEGMVLLGTAGQGGSSFASFYLGKFYSTGSYGLAKDAKRARFWLEKVKNDGEVCKEILDETRDLLASLDEPQTEVQE